MPLPLPLSAPSPGPACCPRHAAGPLRAPARRHPGTGQGATACGSFLTPLELRNARTLCPMAAGRIVPVIVTPIRPSPVSARVFFLPAIRCVERVPGLLVGVTKRAAARLRINYLRGLTGRGRRWACSAGGADRRRRTGVSTRCLPVHAAGRFRNTPPRRASRWARHRASRPIGCRFATVGGRGAPGAVHMLRRAHVVRPLRIVHVLRACVRCGGASSARDPWEQA